MLAARVAKAHAPTTRRLARVVEAAGAKEQLDLLARLAHGEGLHLELKATVVRSTASTALLVGVDVHVDVAEAVHAHELAGLAAFFAYRDSMSLLRFFADQPGREIWLRLSVSLDSDDLAR